MNGFSVGVGTSGALILQTDGTLVSVQCATQKTWIFVGCQNGHRESNKTAVRSQVGQLQV